MALRDLVTKLRASTTLDERFGGIVNNRFKPVAQNFAQAGRNLASPQVWNQNLSNLRQNVASTRQNINQTPLTKNNMFNGIVNNSLNSGQSFLSGMEDVYKGVKTLNPIKSVVGLGRMAAPITPVFQGANFIASNPRPIGTTPNIISPSTQPLPNYDQARRLSRGILQGMTGIDQMASNVPLQKTLSLPLAGKVDPFAAAGSMYGYVQNPVNKQLFKGTEKFFPSNGNIAKWLSNTAIRGGLENVLLSIGDLPDNATAEQKINIVLRSVPEGILSEFVGQGISKGVDLGSKGLGKVDQQIKLTDSAKRQMANLYDGLKEFKRINTIPVKSTRIDEKTGQRIVMPMWKAMLTDQTGGVNNKGADYWDEALNQPKIDRTKLTGKQLDTPNAKLGFEAEMDALNGLDNVPAQISKVEKTSSVKLNDPVEVKSIQKAVSNAKNPSVNIVDMIRTPDRVLNKLGLGKEAEAIRKKHTDYLLDLPKEIDKVNEWYNRVGKDPNSSQRIFNYLDGNKGVQLNPNEKQVASEIQTYLKEWADKLGLPEDNRIASYITHIFEPDFIQKDFDPELAKILADKVPGSTYDPFLQKRLGQQGYVEDVFRALDAYVKRATRKFHMDQALKPLQDKVGKTADASYLDLDSYKYVQNYISRVNMRPTDIDRMLDKFITQSPIGYKFTNRPTANITRKARQMIYRGTLGLNPGSALKNLTQGVNTYSKLGERWTSVGYMKSLRNLFNGDDELKRVGVLADNFVQDRNITVKKRAIEKLDKVLFLLFEGVEKINRGAAYYGAKSRALAYGASEEEAIQAGIKMARDTQFTFGSVDTPPVLQSDIGKTLLQFQSYQIKQGEFITEMISNKEIAGLARWLGANLLILNAAGDLFGLDSPLDFIPFSGIITGENKFLEPPVVQTAKTIAAVATNQKDDYGNERDFTDKVKLLRNDAVKYIPAGSQIKKTYEGLNAYNQGASTTETGRVRFPIKKDTSNLLRTTILGQYKAKEAKDYFKDKPGVLSDKQSQVLKLKPDDQKQNYYDSVISKRGKDEPEKPTDKKPGLLSRLIGKANASESNLSEWESYFEIPEYKAMPSTSNQEKALREDKRQTLISKVIKDEDIEISEKLKLLSTLGEKAEAKDVEYYQVASLENEIKTGFVLDELLRVPDDQKIEYLSNLRKPVLGKYILADGVIDDLYDQGLVDDSEKKYLKGLDYHRAEDGTYLLNENKGKGKKAPKISIAKVKPAKITFTKLTPGQTNIKTRLPKTLKLTKRRKKSRVKLKV